MICSSLAAKPAAEEDAPGRDAEKHHVVGALGAFDDLVGDTGQHPRDVGAFEYGPRVLRALGFLGFLAVLRVLLVLLVLRVHMKRTSFSASRDGR